MQIRKLDGGDDYSFGHGSRDFHANTPDAVAQSVLTRLRLWAGEWYLDTDEGTPYRSGILGKFSDPQARDGLIRQRVLETPGVVGIASFSSVFGGESRTLTVSITIDTIYGPATVTEVL